MKKKGKLWMADWRDEHGMRHRKGFPTLKRARRYAEQQARAAHEKKDRASARYTRSRRPGPRSTTTPLTASQPST